MELSIDFPLMFLAQNFNVSTKIMQKHKMTESTQKIPFFGTVSLPFLNNNRIFQFPMPLKILKTLKYSKIMAKLLGPKHNPLTLCSVYYFSFAQAISTRQKPHQIPLKAFLPNSLEESFAYVAQQMKWNRFREFMKSFEH